MRQSRKSEIGGEERGGGRGGGEKERRAGNLSDRECVADSLNFSSFRPSENRVGSNGSHGNSSVARLYRPLRSTEKEEEEREGLYGRGVKKG